MFVIVINYNLFYFVNLQPVCSKCNSQKIALEYDAGKRSKVCDECYIVISHRDLRTAADEAANVNTKHTSFY